ncbi:MAG: deoxyribonuclease IV [Deltaproteobacteria bacterium]
MKFGVHVSIAGGINNAPREARRIQCECFQIFTRSPQGGNPSNLSPQVVDLFLSECERYNFRDYYVHASYLINLASADERVSRNSVSMLVEELRRASLIQAKYVVTHIGSAKGATKPEAVTRAAQALKRALDSDYTTRLLLENSAGQGAILGSSLEELAEILALAGNPDVGVCLDTAHLFGFGYDIRTPGGLDALLDEFCAIIGIDRLKLIHGNDSKASLGERKDRHEHIGYGKIGIGGFAALVNNPRIRHIDLIAETPIEGAAADVETLKKLRDSAII